MTFDSKLQIDRTRTQMMMVALLVCVFAAGMAGLLNFFKYRAHAERLVQERLVVMGLGIEASIRSSLALGMQFSDLGTLPERMERELQTDTLTRSIEIFDTDGLSLYSTDRLRAARGSYAAWLVAAKAADGESWSVKDGDNSAVGIAIKNGIGLVVGYLALRYAEEDVSRSISAVGRQLALAALLTFLATAVLASLALLVVMRGMLRDMQAMERWLDASATLNSEPVKLKGPFAKPLRRFFGTVRKAESNIGLLSHQLKRGNPSQGGRP
jgi:hypothetical protein